MRLIDADELNFEDLKHEPYPDLTAKAIVDRAPTVDAVPVVYGRWVDRYGGKYANSLYKCSKCKEKALYKAEVDVLGKKQFVQALTSVCPNCEAKMDLR